MSRLFHLLRERMRMIREDALAVSKVVEEAFAGHSELDDDELDPQLRQVFYDLQDEKILNIRRREYQAEGFQRRGYFWSVDETQADLDRWSPKAQRDPTEALYEDLRDRHWQRRPPQV